MLDLDLTGKTVLITGATGDLGRVIARTLADCGAAVALHYHRNEAKARAIQSEIESKGRRATVAQADIGDNSSVRAMGKAISETFGPPQIVVANAVTQYAWKSVLDQPVEDYESQFRSCVLQSVNLAQTFLPAMIDAKWGRFIAINTECVLQCHPSQSAYVSGKRGMDGVLRVLAREAGPAGVTVNQVAPGWMISERDRAGGSESQPAYEQGIPLRHRGEDIEIARAVAFLASDQAGFITGAFLPVCGGNAMTAI